MRVSKSVMAVGGVVVAAAAIGFMDPKAVHAVTALLVQVTNTAANPVVSSEVSRTAAQTVALCDGQTVTGSRTPLQAVLPGGGADGTEYVVPNGESLVITSIDVETGASGYFQLDPVTTGSSGGSIQQIFKLPADGSTHQLQFPSGIVWASGQTIAYHAESGVGQVCMYGYLTRS